MNLRSAYRFVFLATVIVGCTTLGTNYEALYGPSTPRDRVISPEEIKSANLISFKDDIQPILNRRCVVCHSCYDAPCQLNLTSYEGLDRGANKTPVYNGTRFLTAEPTRLGIDAQDTAEWRRKGFFPVLNERAQNGLANLDNSLLYRMLLLKRSDRFPTSGRLSKGYDVGTGQHLDEDFVPHNQQCPTTEKIERFTARHRQWGMPFGYPGLSDADFHTIEDWLVQGAPGEPQEPLAPAVRQEVAKWETFLNGATNKERLMARYLYEHLYLGHLYFDRIDSQVYFQLVRSRTPPGEAIDVIATVRPFDDPGNGPFYYRLKHYDRTIVEKTHMPYALDAKKMARFKALFLDPDYDVDALPSYEPKLAANPFKTFAAIPPKSRYQFMLDDAHFIISGFIKGPVCRGAIALSVIDDHFWVLFTNPDKDPVNNDETFLDQVSDDLRIPSDREDDINLISAWKAYKSYAAQYFLKKRAFLRSIYPPGASFGIEQIWDGGGSNTNASLTVYRHYDSATVVRGFVGEVPKTAWVLDYPLLERIHYLLVAGFNVYGTVGHQLATRTYMDFLRMEAEINFLTFLPAEQRLPLFRLWYRGTNKAEKLEELLAKQTDGGPRVPNLPYRTGDSRREFFVFAHRHLGNAQPFVDRINLCREFPDDCSKLKLKQETATIENALRPISDIGGGTTEAFPNVTFVRVIVDDTLENDRVYTFVHNRSYLNVTALVPKEKSRMKNEDSIDVLNGFVGAYPNFFLVVRLEDLKNFVNEYLDIDSYEAYDALIEKYGIRRSNPRFWQYADWFLDKNRHDNPVYAGVFDLDRYQNR